MRLIQHKREAYWFYWYLSNFYDKFVNPLFWTPRMRDESLVLAELDAPDLTVIDVGSGTGFTTQGIVQHIPPARVTCVDQSPHQMAKARRKPELQGCTFQLGDAENLPYPDNAFDRYVSAGSIEYWPDPAQGIAESFRVIKPGGVALMIGPLEPEHSLGRWIANTWMLFPKESEYRQWYEQAGFEDIKIHYIRPAWFHGKAEYGLAIAGRKSGNWKWEMGNSEEREQHTGSPTNPTITYDEPMSLGRRLQLIWRVIAGSSVAFLFIPAALWGYMGQGNQADVPPQYRERLNGYQIGALLVILLLLAGLAWGIFSLFR